MLIEISAHYDQFDQLTWFIPRLSLDRRFNYKIGLRHLNFEFLESSQTFDTNELFCLTSTLIDLSNRNPSQSLFTFGYDGNNPIFNIIPSIVSYHPVQLYEIDNSSFAIRRYFKETDIELRNIFLQLEILRVDAYGRL